MTDESNNNPIENDEDNRETQREEYLPNIVRLEPDIGLGDHSQEGKRRNPDGSQTRREDGPISFRHFLQNDAGAASSSASSSSACPDLYRYSRQERPNPEGSAVDPESPVLPDFVQDNLALEHIYFNSDFNPKVLPDFTPYESYNPESGEPSRAASSSHRFHEDLAQASNRSNRNRIPLDLPVPNFLSDEPHPAQASSLPFDLTTQTGNASACGDVRSPIELAASGGRLPDFLSDGHILGHGASRHRDPRIITNDNGSSVDSNLERRNLIATLREEIHRLRDEVSVLQSVLMKKDDRIKELEDLVMALEISKLQMSSDANTQTNKSSEDEMAVLRRELEASKRELLKLQKEKVEPGAARSESKVLQDGKNNESALSKAELILKIKKMTDTSERLVKQLMGVICEMKSDFSITDEDIASAEHPESKND
ncbi:uncharacterized protein LOC135840872 [Planococcus citri]|uniref:uncharacterized protein LOC135840872 n=1 Tax=Planococcus citri TaxID=170843 RepID=UPI0031F88F7B